MIFNSFRSDPIYIEVFIASGIDPIWHRTQTPSEHQRWDLRFSHIDYLPRAADKPQQFTYSTTVVPGLTVHGRGESTATRHTRDGIALSGLKFWGDHPLSIIKDGAGSWQYHPTEDGTRFLTVFDYSVRWGRFGSVLDRWLFRPVFGWLTAWSFDRLRLWVEDDVAPELALRQTLTHWVAVSCLAMIWIYQGLIPKVLFPDGGEADVLRGALGDGVPVMAVLSTMAVAEVLVGLAVVVWHRRRWPFVLTAAAMPVLATGGLVGDPLALVRPFNPVTLNLAMAMLAVIVLVTQPGLPDAGRTFRKPNLRTTVTTGATA